MGEFLVGLALSWVQVVLTKVKSAIEDDANQLQRAQRNLVFIAVELEMMQSFLNVSGEEAVKNNLVATWVRTIKELANDIEDCLELGVHLDDRPNWWRRLLPFSMAAPLTLDEAVEEIEQLKVRAEDVSKCYTRYSSINDVNQAAS